ncbi:MAG: hypothetical protein U5O39_10840 [Gammaproteobacteria bacterium]|nr:hypothetical protein [Gammaproteobacteria bacterium]
MTRKREIENYVHPAAIKRVCDNTVDIEGLLPDFDFDFGKISQSDSNFWQEICRAKDKIGFRFPSEVRRGVSLNHQETEACDMRAVSP